MKKLMRSVMVLAMLGLLVAVGCGEGDGPADPPAPGKGVDLPDTADRAPDEGAAAEDEASSAPETILGEDAGASSRPVEVVEPATYAIDRHAGRSPFLLPGEELTSLIPAKRVTDLDPFSQPIDPADIPAVVPWNQAAKYVGHEIVVEGQIVYLGKSGKTNFLNFSRDWRGKFYMVIFDDLAATLSDGVEGTFLNKTVRVRGLVEPHRGVPQIKIESMDQVEVVE